MLKALLGNPGADLRLLVVADPVTSVLDVELLGDRTHAAGVGPFHCDEARTGDCTVVASCVLTVIDPVEVRDDIEVNLAITWARGMRGSGVDVAGTALVFWPGESRPIEFQAVRHDAFNEPGPPAANGTATVRGGTLTSLARAIGRRGLGTVHGFLPGRAVQR